MHILTIISYLLPISYNTYIHIYIHHITPHLPPLHPTITTQHNAPTHSPRIHATHNRPHRKHIRIPLAHHTECVTETTTRQMHTQHHLLSCNITQPVIFLNSPVDNQVVNMSFEGGQTASFSMIAFTQEVCVRKTRIFCTKGELVGDGHQVTVFNFLAKETTYHPLLETQHPASSMNGTWPSYYVMNRYYMLNV